MKLRQFSVVLLSVALAACGARHDDLDDFMATVRQKPGGTLKPLPKFIPTEPFVYTAAGLRAPFDKPQPKDQEQSGKSVAAPDENIDRGPLAKISIEQLKMAGTIQGADGKLWALVSDGAGGVTRVAEGSYLGRNYGQVAKVSNDRIDIIEVVTNGHGGWLERPRTLVMADKNTDKVN